MMKEYITQTLYSEPNLTIGSNGISFIIHQNKNCIVLDKEQILKIEKHFSSGCLPFERDDIYCKQIKDMIVVNQLGNIVSVKKGILGTKLMK